MAIRAIIGFDHLPQNVTSWINYVTHGITRDTGLAAQNVITNGWIVSKATSAGAERVTVPLDEYLVAPVAKIWMGFRCRVVNNTNGAAGSVYLNGTYVYTVSNIPGVVNGTIAYHELSYNVTTGIVERWITVNGVTTKLADMALSAGLRAMTLGLEAKGSTANQLDWRDFYVSDDQGVAQGLPTGPLGPQTCSLITFDAASSPDFTTVPSNASLLTAINEPGAVPTTNIAVSALTKGQLTASLAPVVPAGSSVMAIELVGGVSSNSAAAAVCSGKLKSGSNELLGGSANCPVGSYNYNARFGVFHKSPAGVAWDNAAIDATDFVLTPDV